MFISLLYTKFTKIHRNIFGVQCNIVITHWQDTCHLLMEPASKNALLMQIGQYDLFKLYII